MTFQISPGVSVREFDLSTTVPAVSTSRGAFAGQFSWGPVEQALVCSSEDDLIAKYLMPDAITRVDWMTAASFLAYSNFLYVSRVIDFAESTGSKNSASTAAGVAGTGVLIKNDVHADSVTIGATTAFVGRFPGLYGNDIRTYLLAASSTNLPYLDLVSKFANVATSALDKTIYGAMIAQIGRNYPGTSKFAADAGSTLDEVHVFVVDYTGKFSGVAGTILESYLGVSLASDAKTVDGNSNYYSGVLNQQSKFVRFGNHLTALASTNLGTPVGPAKSYAATTPVAALLTQVYGGGSDGTTINASDYITAYNVYQSAENIDISLLIGGAVDGTTALHLIQNIAEKRKDCIAFISPLKENVVNSQNPLEDVIEFRDPLLSDGGVSVSTLTGYSSSYAVLDCNWKYMYDRYNDVSVWVPLSGDVAGLCARTDADRDAWWSPAGFNRGSIKNALRLAWNPTEAQRDVLYSAGINPIVNFAGRGTVLFGDKTLQSKPSAFDRINVRRLFIVLEKAIAIAAQYSLFEVNDTFTQAGFKALVEPFLRDVQGRRGIAKFAVVVDERVNTPQVIQSNSFIAQVFVVPLYSVNFIRLDFVAVGPTANFEEVIGSGVI